MLRLFVPLALSLLLAAFASAHRWSFDRRRDGFDYFIFTLQWPGTVCSSHSTCCSRLSTDSGFTIHGIWPEYNSGAWPQCCNGPSFDETKISTLVSELQSYWPSLTCSSSTGCHGKIKVSFWGHEWEKHGTCAHPVIQNEYDYFATALQLYKKYDLLAILVEAGFTPLSNEHYNASSVAAAITEALGAMPALVCSNGRLQEVRLCFTKDFKVRDCGGISEVFPLDLDWSSSSCPWELLIPPLSSSKERHLIMPDLLPV